MLLHRWKLCLLLLQTHLTGSDVRRSDLPRLFPDCQHCRSAAHCRSDVELRHLTENNFYNVILARLESLSASASRRHESRSGSETSEAHPAVLRMYTSSRDDDVSLFSAPPSSSVYNMRKLPRLVKTFIAERRHSANEKASPASCVTWQGFPAIAQSSCGSAGMRTVFGFEVFVVVVLSSDKVFLYKWHNFVIFLNIWSLEFLNSMMGGILRFVFVICFTRLIC